MSHLATVREIRFINIPMSFVFYFNLVRMFVCTSEKPFNKGWSIIKYVCMYLVPTGTRI